METLDTIMLNQSSCRVIQLCRLHDWERTDETWISPEGKTIPFVRLARKIKKSEHDEGCSYSIQISIWPKNISVEIVKHLGFNEIDFLEIDMEIHIYRITKVSHDTFIANHDEIIGNAQVFFDRRFRI